MIEAEAKKKWCPFVRVTIGPDNADWQGVLLTNRGTAPADHTDLRCIGSDCMAWHWRREPGKPGGFAESEPGCGYCGLTNRK